MKRTIALLICAVMAIMCIPATVVSAAPEGYTVINNVNDFKALMSDNTKWEGKYALGADLDLTGVAITAIGTEAKPFKGIFDGQDHKITGIDVKSEGYSALFGCTDTAEIRNLTVSGKAESLGTNKNAELTNCTAGLIAYATGGLIVENVTVNMDIKGIGFTGGIIGNVWHDYCDMTIQNCVVNGSIVSTAAHTGGIVGSLESSGSDTNPLKITNCVNNASVDTTGSDPSVGCPTGGIVGRTLGSCYIEITNCTNNGKISANPGETNSDGGNGGMIGRGNNSSVAIWLKLANCYNTGEINGGYYAGGMMGYLNSTSGAAHDTVVEQCTNTAKIEGARYGAGIVGYPRAQDTSESFRIIINDCLNRGDITATNNVVGSTTTGGITGYNVRIDVNNCVNYGIISQPNVAAVETPTRIGGIIGYSYSYGATNCYSVGMDPFGSVRAESFTVDENSKQITADEAKVQATYKGFDFDKIWTMTASGPALKNCGATIGATQPDTPVVTEPVVTDAPVVTTAAPVVTDAPVVTTAAPTQAEPTPSTGSNAYILMVFAAISALVAIVVIKKRIKA